jgi:hypothetical protein
MNKLISLTAGKKTYIACGLMIAYVIIGYAIGKGFDLELLLEALAIAGLRNSLTK